MTQVQGAPRHTLAPPHAMCIRIPLIQPRVVSRVLVIAHNAFIPTRYTHVRKSKKKGVEGVGGRRVWSMSRG